MLVSAKRSVCVQAFRSVQICFCVCATVQQQGLGLTVPINISIKAAPRRGVEHLSSSQLTFSVAEEAIMCHERLLIESQPVLVDMSASLAPLLWVYLIALRTTAAR